jgi:hypothetical protein
MNNATDLQQILTTHLSTYRQHHRIDPRSRQVLAHLKQCRTEAMGGVRLQCNPCEQEQIHYYACRDRHCPKCQWQAAQLWAGKQRLSQLPVNYHHLVFTLPETLNGWIGLHPEVLYPLLFQSAWETLRAFGEDPKRLGGQMGMTAVLHTWGSTLIRHVHLHCLAPGGAITSEGTWQASKSDYLFPVRALSQRFRGKLVSQLRACAQAGKLHRITREGEIDEILDRLMAQDWVVYSKPCLKAGVRVIDYLARYTHRTAISNARILQLEQSKVAFRYRDTQDDNRWKVMRLAVEEFIRRFLLHVLPKGLMRIRHYGFLANACRSKQLPRIRQAIAQEQQQEADEAELEQDTMTAAETGCYLCPNCHRPMRVIAEIAPRHDRWEGGGQCANTPLTSTGKHQHIR